jgi:hypothetical protein
MQRRIVMASAGLAATLILGAAAVVLAPAASAEPTTVTKYPITASSTHFKGKAFDACTAPSFATMNAWLASPYTGIGVYVGGENRGCAQPNLTSTWVSQVTTMGWRLLPIYVGKQAPCTNRTGATKFTSSNAATQGTAAATDAITQLKSLGMVPGSPVYYDMENYDSTNTSCRTAVRTFVSAFTKALHAKGYLAGVYANLGSGAKHLAGSYTSTSYARPDLIWVARWDGESSLFGLTGISDNYWGQHQRAKQYKGDHSETYGGVSITIDTDYVDAAAATVARAYTTEGGTTHTRTGPSTSTTEVATITSGTPVSVLCQTLGTDRLGTKVWDKLSNGRYISDHYVDTASDTTFTSGIPRCYYPYQVTVAESLSKRSGPSGSAEKLGEIRTGGLAWVQCQKSGSLTRTTKIWDKIIGNYWVTDYYVATASNTTYTSPSPRCY